MRTPNTLSEQLNSFFGISENNYPIPQNSIERYQKTVELSNLFNELNESTAENNDDIFSPYISEKSLLKAFFDRLSDAEYRVKMDEYDESLKTAKYHFTPFIPASEFTDIGEYIAQNNLHIILTKVVLKGLLRYSTRRKAHIANTAKKAPSFRNDWAIERIITSGYNDQIFDDMTQNVALCIYETLIPNGMISFVPFENDLCLFDIHFDIDQKAYIKLWNVVQNTFTQCHGHSYSVKHASIESLSEIGVQFQTAENDIETRLANIRYIDSFHANMCIMKIFMKDKMYHELTAIIEGILKGYNLETINKATNIRCDYVISKARFFHCFALLVQKGHTQNYICKTMNISEKTYNRYIAKLPADFGKMEFAI